MKTHQGEFEMKEKTSLIICLVDVLLMLTDEIWLYKRQYELLLNLILQIAGSVRSPAEVVEARGEINTLFNCVDFSLLSSWY